MNNLVDSRQMEKGNFKTLTTTEKRAIVLIYTQLKNAYLITQNRQNLVVTHSGHSHIQEKRRRRKNFFNFVFSNFFLSFFLQPIGTWRSTLWTWTTTPSSSAKSPTCPSSRERPTSQSGSQQKIRESSTDLSCRLDSFLKFLFWHFLR